MNKRRSSVTRREVLVGSAMALGAATVPVASRVGTAKAAPAKASSTPTVAGVDYDAIVIGGGFAGVTAARELGRDGRKVLLIEARNRLGGRTFTSTFAGQQVEFGGQYVHWLQPHMWAELGRYDKTLAANGGFEPTRTLVMQPNGTLQGISPVQFDDNLTVSLSRFCARMRELFPRPNDMYFNAEVRRLDRVSAAKHIASLGLTPIQSAQATAYIELYFGGAATEAPYVEFVKHVALAGWNLDAFHETSNAFNIREGGTAGLIQAMISDSRAEVRMSSFVKAVEQRVDKVHVTTDDGVNVTGAAVVITVPTACYPSIEFSPQLPAGKRKFISIGEMSRGAMLYMRVRQDVGKVFGMCDLPNPFTWIQTYGRDPETGGTILNSGLASDQAVDLNSRAALQAALRKIFPGVDLIDFSAYDWPADPAAKQGWPGMRIGQLALVEDMARPEGRLFFAGCSTARGWNMYMDGAIESGIRAAAEARALLNRRQS